MRIAGLEIKIERSAYSAFLILAGIPVLVRGAYITIFRRQELHRRSILSLPLLGVCVASFHAIGQLSHQLGHALAARATGHPMTGIRYEYAFTYSEYPLDEVPLTDRVHLQRSLGGVVGATLVLVIAGLLWLRRGLASNGFARWLLAFVLIDAMILFIGSAIFSDGVQFIREEAWKARQPEV